jgi:hypothetical protein
MKKNWLLNGEGVDYQPQFLMKVGFQQGIQVPYINLYVVLVFFDGNSRQYT